MQTALNDWHTSLTNEINLSREQRLDVKLKYSEKTSKSSRNRSKIRPHGIMFWHSFITLNESNKLGYNAKPRYKYYICKKETYSGNSFVYQTSYKELPIYNLRRWWGRIYNTTSALTLWEWRFTAKFRKDHHVSFTQYSGKIY